MKTDYKNIILFVNILDKYSTYKLPQKINFAITKNLINLNIHVEIYSRSLENIYNVYDSYMLKDEDGNNLCYDSGLYQVDDAHFKEYSDEITQLLDTEVEIDLYYVDFSVFDYDDGEKYDLLSPSDIITLKQILCKSDEEKEDG